MGEAKCCKSRQISHVLTCWSKARFSLVALPEMINSIQASKDATTTWATDMVIASHYRGSRWTENNCWFVHSLSIHLTACVLSSLDVSAFPHLKIHIGGYSYHVEIVAKSSKNRPGIVLNWNYQFSGREAGSLSKHTVVCTFTEN